MARSTPNKSAFVRELPASMPVKEVVAKAKAAGLKIDEKYVSTIRYNAKVSARKKGTPDGAPKRGPGRPRKSSFADNGTVDNGRTVGTHTNGLVAEIERIVEARVSAILQQRLGGLFGA